MQTMQNKLFFVRHRNPKNEINIAVLNIVSFPLNIYFVVILCTM